MKRLTAALLALALVVQLPSAVVINSYRFAAAGGSAPTISSVSAVNTDGASDDPETYDHTIATLSDGAIVVVIQYLSAANSVAAVTFDGSAMTELAHVQNAISLSHVYVYGLKVANKTGGTYTISIDLALGTGGEIASASIALNGVNQTTPFGTGVSATGATSPATVNASSAATELVIDVASVVAAANTLTAGAGQTVNTGFPVTNSSVRTSSSWETGAATTTMSWTLGSNNQWAIAAVPVKGL